MAKARRRGTRKGSPQLHSVMTEASSALRSAFDVSATLHHPGVKGDGREAAVRHFLTGQLPQRFGVTSGILVDFSGRQSPQLDVIVYDQSVNAPLVPSADGRAAILPAEAALAIVEVKSKLTADEVVKCLGAASKLKDLRPHKKTFRTRRRDGEPASDRAPRCPYHVFAFTSDLVADDFPSNEWSRLATVANERQVALEAIAQIMILDRGLIDAPTQRALAAASDDGRGLLSWYLSLSNFLSRETDRRSAVDWNLYASKDRSDWEDIRA